MVTIPTIDQISGTTVMNKMRSLIHNYIEFGTEVGNSITYMENVIANLPQDITDVYNKETIDTMFTNYYTKSQTYTKSEVDSLISTVGTFHAVIVDSLPTYGNEGIIYLVKIAESGTNKYKEYIWVNQWELIGEISNVDLANYYTKTQVDNLVSPKANSADVYTKTEVDNKLALKENVVKSNVAYLDAATISGLSITKQDGRSRSIMAIRYGDLLVINYGVRVTGTFTGTTNWYKLYSYNNELLETGESLIYPYALENQDLLTLEGGALFLINGSSFNDAFYSGQVVAKITR